MWKQLAFIYFNFLISCVSSESHDLGDVVFVSLLFRHGDRTPVQPYPNDPYKNNSIWPVGWGELTNLGKENHYELGKWLRTRYKTLIPQHYNREDIHIQSTDVDRTLMSAYSNLAGLYEPDLKSNWNHQIKWTPIPVHTIPENLDKVLAGKAPCPQYNKEYEKLLSSSEFQKINERYKKLYDYLTKVSGENISNVIDVARLYDTLFIENFYNFTLPNWTKTVYPEPVKSIAEFTFSIPCYTQTLAKFKMGPFFSEILNHMHRKIEKKLKEKVWMYSAHDTTIANVLKSLNLFQPHCPPYRSLIMFELRKKNNEYFVAIHYRNSSSVPPYFLQLDGCDKLCPFDQFKKIIKPLIPNDWEEECQAVLFSESFYSTTASISFITMVSLALLFLLSLTIVLRFYKNQRWNQTDFAYRSLKMDIAS